MHSFKHLKLTRYQKMMKEKHKKHQIYNGSIQTNLHLVSSNPS